MARTPFVAGNWKMNLVRPQAEALVKGVVERLGGLRGVDVALCPPFTALAWVSSLLEGANVALGAQNMCWAKEGAFTGEISGAMLKDVGCRCVILGHSERRQIFGETDEVINGKLGAALDCGLEVILCLGETLDERQAARTFEVVGRQLEGTLKGIGGDRMAAVTIAYEPVWAIGTGKTASPEQAQEVHRFLRARLEKVCGAAIAAATRILYGGSVKPANAAELFRQADIDGGLIGGASLEAESFARICTAAAG